MKFKYNNTEMTDFNFIVNLKSLMSEKAYDVYIHCNDNLWLGADGKIYEFEYIPCREQYIKEYSGWEEFNSLYPSL